jgi:hypothetical protein
MQDLGLERILWNDLGNRKWMRFGTWNVSSLYRARSLKAAASELVKYN